MQSAKFLFSKHLFQLLYQFFWFIRRSSIRNYNLTFLINNQETRNRNGTSLVTQFTIDCLSQFLTRQQMITLQPIIRYRFSPSLFFLRTVNGQVQISHIQILSLFLESRYVTKHFLTRTAPGSPHIHIHHLTSQRLQGFADGCHRRIARQQVIQVFI